MRALLIGLLGVLLAAGEAAAQFRDDFEGNAPRGWTAFTGDGLATAEFRVAGGRGYLAVDATRDRDNIWWATIKRNVASQLDVARLASPGHELRLEARVRLREAPRRVHMQANTQRTTDFHLNLREFDLPDTLWHVISMTTRRLDARSGDDVNVQLALTDAGLHRYVVEVDWIRAEVVDTASAPPDVGEPLVYQPPPGHADPALYRHGLDVAQSAVIDEQYPEVGFPDWKELSGGSAEPVLSVGGTRYTILRWDLRPSARRRAVGHGMLELTTRSLQLGPTEPEEYGQVRVVEIFAGDTAWERRTVTAQSLTRGRPLESILNPQILIDSRVAAQTGARTRITISRAVLQRLLDGRTVGLLLRPLGPIEATFAVSPPPRLYFDLQGEEAR